MLNIHISCASSSLWMNDLLSECLNTMRIVRSS